MQQLQLSKAWEQWQFWYAEVKQQQFMMSGAIRRMQQLQLSKAWEQWQFWYEQHMNLLGRMKGAVNRMLKRQLSMAWESWQAWYADLMEQKRKLAQVILPSKHKFYFALDDSGLFH